MSCCFRSVERCNATLLESAASGSVESARRALSAGADVHCRDENGRGVLHLAGVRGHTGMVQLLFSHGADVNARDRDETTPLIAASRSGTGSVVRSLLATQQVEIDAVDDGNCTALHQACRHNNLLAVAALLEAGADCAIAAKDGITARDCAVSNHRVSVLTALDRAMMGEDRRLKRVRQRLAFAKLLSPRLAPVIMQGYVHEIAGLAQLIVSGLEAPPRSASAQDFRRVPSTVALRDLAERKMQQQAGYKGTIFSALRAHNLDVTQRLRMPGGLKRMAPPPVPLQLSGLQAEAVRLSEFEAGGDAELERILSEPSFFATHRRSLSSTSLAKQSLASASRSSFSALTAIAREGSMAALEREREQAALEAEEDARVQAIIEGQSFVVKERNPLRGTSPPAKAMLLIPATARANELSPSFGREVLDDRDDPEDARP